MMGCMWWEKLTVGCVENSFDSSALYVGPVYDMPARAVQLLINWVPGNSCKVLAAFNDCSNIFSYVRAGFDPSAVSCKDNFCLIFCNCDNNISLSLN